MTKITIGGIVKTSIVTAFTIATALIWKDFLEELFRTLVPGEKALFYKFVLAVFSTIIVIFAIYFILRTESKAEKIIKKLKFKKIKRSRLKEYDSLARSLRRNYDSRMFRKLKDMKNSFLDRKEVRSILAKSNPVIYAVYKRAENRNTNAAITIINPGAVRNEYYMTKGHKNRKPLDENYILLKGEGKLILQGHDYKVIKLKKGKKFVVPGKYAHRLVNTGKKKLEVLTIYPKDAGNDYRVNFEKRIFKR